MGAVEKIGRAYQRDKENGVRQKVESRNQFRRVMPSSSLSPNETSLELGKSPGWRSLYLKKLREVLIIRQYPMRYMLILLPMPMLRKNKS